MFSLQNKFKGTRKNLRDTLLLTERSILRFGWHSAVSPPFFLCNLIASPLQSSLVWCTSCTGRWHPAALTAGTFPEGSPSLKAAAEHWKVWGGVLVSRSITEALPPLDVHLWKKSIVILGGVVRFKMSFAAYLGVESLLWPWFACMTLGHCTEACVQHWLILRSG